MSMRSLVSQGLLQGPQGYTLTSVIPWGTPSDHRDAMDVNIFVDPGQPEDPRDVNISVVPGDPRGLYVSGIPGVARDYKSRDTRDHRDQPP